MASQHYPVKCRRCRRWVPVLYYDSHRHGFLCHACHHEMMDKRMLELKNFKRHEAKRSVCGQCGDRVSSLYFEVRINRFICIDCQAATGIKALSLFLSLHAEAVGM